MTDPCIKKYDNRPIPKSTVVYKVCKCGHESYDHDGTIWKGKCTSCMCEKFDKLGYFTLSGWERLELCND